MVVERREVSMNQGEPFSKYHINSRIPGKMFRIKKYAPGTKIIFDEGGLNDTFYDKPLDLSVNEILDLIKKYEDGREL